MEPELTELRATVTRQAGEIEALRGLVHGLAIRLASVEALHLPAVLAVGRREYDRRKARAEAEIQKDRAAGVRFANDV